MKLKNKIAFITGASSGIGKATAELFVQEGAKVAMADFSPAEKEILEKIGKSAWFLPVDVRKEEDIEHAIRDTVKQFGQIDILMNNAGIGRNILIEKMSAEEWNNVINTNLRGAFLGIKHVVPLMKKRKKGVIINTASELAFVGDIGWSAYAASKGGIIQLTKVAAVELVDYNIRVNALCPGPTATPLLLKGITKKEKNRIEKLVPLGRLGKPEEIAHGALFLASDDSSFMTGASLLMDGGIIARE
jgi:NAD(P)-dependent dehydrogenase (short-subunit alcohol dehydrogenase family)